MELKDHSFIKAVIFDMDGVLVDSEHWWPKVEGDFYERITDWKWVKNDIEKFIGKSIPDMYRALTAEYSVNIDSVAFFNEYNRMARDVYAQARLMPHARETLEGFYSRSLPLALASSSPHSWINIVTSRFALAQYFSEIVSSEDVGFAGKPAPDVYLYTAQKLNIEPAHCLVIEDSENGILSAKAAGMTAIGYRTPNNQNQDLKKADIIIADLAEITSRYIHALNQT